MAKSIISFLPLFVLLVIVADVTNAQKVCTTNAECRRNSCIIGFCRSPSQATGPCDAANGGDDGDCWGGNVCINAQCSPPSAVGDGCDEGDDGDCDDGLFCLNTVCNPTSCSSNNECSAGNTCINDVCAPLSDVGGSCDLSDVNEDCVDGLVCTSSTCSLGWIPQTTMPQSRATGAAGTIGDSIYLAVGNTAVTSRFQFDSPQWPTDPSFDSFPSGTRTFSASAVVNGKLFVMGGFFSDGSATNEVWSFDPSQPSGSSPSEQWKSLTAMSGPRYGACAASYDNRWIYLFGGFDSSNAATNTIFVFDTSAGDDGEGSWTTLVDGNGDPVTLSQAMAYCAAAQADGYIFITGGFPGGTPLNTILRFEPDVNGGGAFVPFDDPVPVLNTARFYHTATTVNGKIVIAGGIGLSGFLASAEMFDPSSNTVSSLPPMNFGRSAHQASALGSNLFVFGGVGPEASAERLFLPA